MDELGQRAMQDAVHIQVGVRTTRGEATGGDKGVKGKELPLEEGIEGTTFAFHEP
jgi:hypothetical protein